MLWQELHRNNEYIISGVSPHFRRLLHDSPPPREVMEVGCGQGRNIGYVARLHTDIGLYANDVSTDAVQLITHPNINRAICDSRATPAKSGTLTHALSWRVIHHYDERGRTEAAEELRRLLQPGGTLILAARSINDWGHGLGTQTEEHSYVVVDKTELPEGFVYYPKSECHAWHFFPQKELVQLLERQRFNIEELHPMEEPAGLPKWYKGNNAYWAIRATRTAKPRLWHLGSAEANHG
jgi:SAM-dependent methyltransferase